MKKHLISTGLLILFTVWYFINEVYPILTLINTDILYNYILLYSGIGLIVYFMGYRSIRKPEKSWLIAQVALLFLLFYGFFKDKSGIIVPFLNRHSIAIPLWIILNCFLLYRIIVSKHSFIKFQKAAGICILLFLGYAAFNIISKTDYHSRAENIYTSFPASKELPDLYIFVFDEMARLDQLQQFGYDTAIFQQQMKAEGINYLPASYSYFDLTPISVASTLNASVAEAGDLQYPLTNFQKVLLWNEYRNNYLQPYLKELGYETKLYGIMPFSNLESYTNYSILRKSTRTLLRQNTFTGRINEEISWNVVKYNVPVLKKLFLDAENNYNYTLFRNDSINLTAMMEFLNHPATDKPTFILGHLLFPHYPFSRDTAGNFYYANTLDKEPGERNLDYLKQYKYAEKVILELTEKIKKETRPVIAIFMGDHGYRWTADSSLSNKSFLAYYSNLPLLKVSDSTSGVNLMRTILNQYYGFNLPMDSSAVKLLFY